MKITKGIKARALKVLVYGTEGIGKSTFASKFPEPLFIDLEGGTHYLNVSRVDGIITWLDLLEAIGEITTENVCRTLVIDTVDWAERMAIRYICDKYQKGGIEDFGYGAGYTYLVEEFGKLLKCLDRAIAHNINVVILAHATLRTITLPEEQGNYDHWELKLNTKTTNKVAPLVKEWADMVLFANYKTILVEDKAAGAKKKAVGGKRMMYTTHTTFCDAKNRFGLAPELPFDYKEISSVVFDMGVPDLPATLEEIPEEVPRKEKAFLKLEELCRKDAVTEHQIQEAVAQKGYYDVKVPIEEYDLDFIEGVLIGAWEQIKEFIKTHPFDTDVPF